MLVESQAALAAQGGVEPFHLDAPDGRLYAAYHRPAASIAPRGNVLWVAPFNEEMNRCRSMVTLQAQALCALGIGTLVVDLHGTGDSEGEYVDARWDIWQNDIRAGIAWLDGQPGGCRALWGIRLGCILAAEALHNGAAPGAALIVWQPIADGMQYLTQFLRMRIAAQMDQAHLPKETTAMMRQQFAAGRSVEVSGYEINPQLAMAIDAARLAAVPPPAQTRVLWLEQATSGSSTVAPASQKVIDVWRSAGVDPDARVFEGLAFWQLHERTVAPVAISETISWARENWATA